MPALEDIVYSEEDVGVEADFSNLETSITVSPILTTRVHKDHPMTQIIGNLSSAPQTRSMTRMVKEQDLPKGKRAIGLKWVFRNKKDERGIVIKNKARLVAHGHTQEEGIDYEEVFAPIARIEAIRLFLAYASSMGFMVYQMDVKSAFLYGTIKEEVCACQPSGFEDPDYPDKQKDDRIFISQDKYIAKILRKFSLTYGKSASTPIDTEKPLLKDLNGEDVDVHIYRSILMYLTSSRPDIMFAVCACARFQITPKVSHLHEVKRIFRYLKDKPHLGLWYPKDSPFNLMAYSDSDYAGASLDRKSITGDLVSPKQTALGKDESNPLIITATSVSIKKSNDIVSLQALIDWKKVIITEDTIRQALRLDYAAGVDCLPNEEIFVELARIMVRNVDSPSKFLMYPRFLQLMINAQVNDLSSYNTKYTSLALTQKVFVNMRRIGKGFSGVDTPLFDAQTAQPSSPAPQQPSQIADISHSTMTLLNTLLETFATLTKRMHPNKGEIAELDGDEDVTLVDAEEDMNADDTNEAEPAKVEEVIEVVIAAKLMTEVVTTAANTITTTQVPKASVPRRMRGVVIQDPEETATASVIVHTKVKSKDKGKIILIEEPKALKRQAQIKQDEAFAKQLEAELNANINWDDVMKQVKRREKQDNTVMRYQALKRKLVTEAQARKNMMIYLNNMAGFKMDFFKGMTYNDIRPIFEKHYNFIQDFLEK
nr:hypothetical protein [Tanacetum cinerariifolium]